MIGAYVDAVFFVAPTDKKEQALAVVHQLEAHLQEACIGSISEIFDGDAPHKPRGCFAQAWSVAELLRVTIEHNLFGFVPKTQKEKLNV